MAQQQTKKSSVVTADIERLRQELAQLCRYVRPVENRINGRVECGTVIKGT